MDFLKPKPKQPAKPRLLSDKPSLIRKVDAPKVSPLKIMPGIFKPYYAVIKGDIENVLHIDEETKRKNQEHKDFMENYFGRKE